MKFILTKLKKHLLESFSIRTQNILKTFGVKQILSGPAQALEHTKLQIITMSIDPVLFGLHE